MIDTVKDGTAALQLLFTNEYDVVILDLKMPKMDGIEVIEAFNQSKPEETPWVVIVTAYPPGAPESARLAGNLGVRSLLKKPFELSELMGVVRELVKARRQLLDSARRGVGSQCQWTLGFSDRGSAFIQIKGLLNFADGCPSPWTRGDLLMVGQQVEIMDELLGKSGPLSHHWKFSAKTAGAELFGRLFVGNVLESFVATGSAVLYSKDLRLTFVGPRHYLKLPLEFLNDGSGYLVLRHPLKRFVSGVRSRGHMSLSDFLDELHSRQEKLRILLIASNTPPAIDGAEEEVEILYNWFRQKLPPDRFTLDYLPTEKATHNEVMTRLTGCRYHLLHYAGHGHYDEQLPGKSSLFFWEKMGKQGKILPLTLDALGNTLRRKGNQLRFIYLGCCFSTTIDSENLLLQDIPKKPANMTRRYYLNNIRALLIEGFTDKEIRRLCFDMPDFRAVFDQLAENTGKDEIVDRIIEQADRKLQLEILLALTQERVPSARYERHQPYYDPNPTSMAFGGANPQAKSQSAENVSLTDDFLGIADGLIVSGVPSVLAFRWPIHEQVAKELALTFYESLLDQGNFSTALFNARCKVAGVAGQDSDDWLSPILIAQGWR